LDGASFPAGDIGRGGRKAVGGFLPFGKKDKYSKYCIHDIDSHAKRVTDLIFIDMLENFERIQIGMAKFERALEESKN
jgi:hypothetical protein